MHCRRFLPSLFPLPFFLLLLVIVRIPRSLGNPGLYRDCHDKRFQCGDISVAYPFSGDGIPPGCGHPGLQLRCGESIATIEILDVRYQVLHINEESRILSIARQDFKNDICQPQMGSSVLDSTLFNIIPGYANVTLFYDCTSVTPSPIGSYKYCNADRGSRNVSITPPAVGSVVYFPSWVYKHLDQAIDLSLDGVTGAEEEEIKRKLIVVSLWCIQTIPSDRPSMSKVLEMLTRSLQSLAIPPRPFVTSPVRFPNASSETSSLMLA